MKKIWICALIAGSFVSFEARAQERAGDAALGAVSGAVVLGPVGAVAGALIGYTAGPSIAHSWGARRSSPRPRVQRTSQSGTAPSRRPRAVLLRRHRQNLPRLWPPRNCRRFRVSNRSSGRSDPSASKNLTRRANHRQIGNIGRMQARAGKPVAVFFKSIHERRFIARVVALCRQARFRSISLRA